MLQCVVVVVVLTALTTVKVFPRIVDSRHPSRVTNVQSEQSVVVFDPKKEHRSLDDDLYIVPSNF